MANGTLKVSNIQTSSGSGTITLGQSGETVTIPSGATVSGLASNQHKFSAYLSSNQTGLSSGSWNKVNLNAEKWDTSSYYNISNYRFLPTDGDSAYYQFNAQIDLGGTPSYSIIALYKNGSMFKRGSGIYSSGVSESWTSVSGTILLNGSTDYVELYCYATFSGTGTFFGGATGDTCWLDGYKIIGA